MAKEAGSSQHRTGPADQTAAEQILKGAANLIPMGMMHHAKNHATATFEFTKKLSQAKDIHDRVRIHAEHAQAHVNLFNERAKELTEMMGVVANFVGAVVSQYRLHKNLGDMARQSSAHKAADTEHQTGSSKAKRG
jgi:hypothetical protein